MVVLGIVQHAYNINNKKLETISHINHIITLIISFFGSMEKRKVYYYEENLFCIPLLILFVISPSFSFEINMSKDEILRLESTYLLKDLSVGDKIKVSNWSFCNYKGKLSILDTHSKTGYTSEYSPNYTLTILPSSTVSLEIQTKNKKGEKFELSDLIPDHINQTCNQYKEDLNLPNAKVIVVKSVNGFKNLKSYVNYLKKKGFKNK